MTGTSPNWIARLAWAALLLVAGAGLTIWTLSRWQDGARFFGVVPQPAAQLALAPAASPVAQTPVAAPVTDPATAAHIAMLEQRLATVEHATQRAEGSAGRADAMLVAFAARRAIDRGVALGYLEPLLVDRFGATEQGAVATVVTSGRSPQTIDALTSEYEQLGPILRGPGPNESVWTGIRRELGNLVSVHRADRPNPLPLARYDRALAALRDGKTGVALAETMRMPGASRPEAAGWIERARREVLVTRALDQLESAALLGSGGSR